MQQPGSTAELGTIGGIVAGVVGGSLFLGFWRLFEFPLLLALVIGLVGFGAAALILRRRPEDLEIALPGLSREMVQTALREGGEKLSELKELSRRLSDPSIRSRFDGVVASADKILEDLRKNPKDIRAARQFLNYYLEATIKIVGTYAELADKNLPSADIQASLRKAESMLDMIRAAFEKQHARLLEDDVLDLDAEMSLLKQTITMEGLGPEAGAGKPAEENRQ